MLVGGVGAVRARRLIEMMGSAGAVLGAGRERLGAVRGIGAETAKRIEAEGAGCVVRAREELGRSREAGIRAVLHGDAGYPALLRGVANGPLVLYVRGELDGSGMYGVGIVGSRRATAYGIEQADRLSAGLAGAGLTVVSGGARGVDTAAHRAAVRVGGKTVVVMGCGLGYCYPPENKAFFEEVVESGGALVSELPMGVAPSAEHFPARNRIISGMSLGVVVIEAPASSGALITARLAGEEHGREVMAVPGRVDSASSEGSNALIKNGGASLVTCAADVIAQVEQCAWHAHNGTHGVRYGAGVFEEQGDRKADGGGANERVVGVSDAQQQILEAIGDGGSLDEVCRRTGMMADEVAGSVTILEIKRLVKREGSVLRRC